MTNKERYRFFPIENLESALSTPELKGAAQITVNGKTARFPYMNLSGEMNEVLIKYPKNSTSEIFIELKVQRNTSARAIIHHLPSSGVGRCHLKVLMQEGASLELAEITRTHSSLQLISRYEVSDNCSLKVTTLDIDNKLMSRDQKYDIAAKGASVSVKGLFLSAEGENIDNYIKMSHLSSDSESSQDYRGICSGSASFLGHIYIAPDAQRSTALQQSRNIVTSDRADVHTRPWLEIYADDVKCNHGATVGTSDDEQLFYMRQRGIPTEDAKRLLLEGFLNPIAEAAAFSSKNNMINIKSKLLSL